VNPGEPIIYGSNWIRIHQILSYQNFSYNFAAKFPCFLYIHFVDEETPSKQMKILAGRRKKKRTKVKIVISFKATGSGSVYYLRIRIQESQ